MTVPSTKGVMLQQVVERIQELLDTGRLSRDELEARLESGDLTYFEGEKILPTLWYAATQHERLLGLYATHKADRQEAIVDLGRESARPILANPAFAQLFEAAGRRDEAGAGALLVKLAELVLNFTKWTFHGASLDDFTIDVTEATDYTDNACLLAVGFMETLANELLDKRMRVVFERPTPDHVVFRPLGPSRAAAEVPE